MLWIERLIVEGEKQKLFDVAPPVLSRAFQELSNGVLAQLLWPCLHYVQALTHGHSCTVGEMAGRLCA